MLSQLTGRFSEASCEVHILSFMQGFRFRSRFAFGAVPGPKSLKKPSARFACYTLPKEDLRRPILAIFPVFERSHVPYIG
jgi:hypothetical protein